MDEEINQEKLNHMMKRIIDLEKEYAQTNEGKNRGKDNEIKNKIKKIIEEETECY